MQLRSLPYYHAGLSFFIFLASGIACILLQDSWLLVIPFAWVLLPVAYHIIVVKPENIFWLLCIVLPLSTELNLTPQLGFDFPDELLLLLLTGLAVIKTIHQPSWLPRAFGKSDLFMLVVVQLVWIIVTCLFSVEPLLSVKYLLAKIWYILPFVVLPQVILTSKQNIGKLAICLLVPMLFVVIQALIRHSAYHFSFADVKRAMSPFFRNHVNYSAMLVCLLPVAWCVWKLTPTGGFRRLFIFIAILIGITGLLFSYSRGSWIALITGFSAMWIIQKKWMGILVATALIGILVSTVWLVTDNKYLQFAPDHDRTIFHEDFREHLQATIDMKDVSTAERFYRWVAGARMLAEKPVTGFGPNSFYPHYKSYTVNSFETWVSDNKEHSTVHNYFILTALEQGVIGLAIFCVLYFAMLLRLQRLYHRFQSRFYQTVCLTIGAVLVMIGVINGLSDMIETDKIGSLFWLCLGMIIVLETKNKEEEKALA